MHSFHFSSVHIEVNLEFTTGVRGLSVTISLSISLSIYPYMDGEGGGR